MRCGIGRPSVATTAADTVGRVFRLPDLSPGMDLQDVEADIEASIPDADAKVTHARDPEDDDHLAAVVVSPAFAGETLVDRHQLVHDALGDRMTTEIHALEVQTYTPDEWAETTEGD
jgi:stress-induced morphogen